MITKEIKNLFEFIEFLHSNIDNFKKYDKTIKQLYDLVRQRSKLNPRNNFKDKLRYDKIQTEIKEKIKPVKKNIIEKIQYETKKNDIYNWNTDNINGKISLEIHKLKDNFNAEDIPIIILHKKRYIEFRTKTNYTYFNDFFFNELDEQLKVLFDFFNESTVNEFEAFEIKTTKVNNFQEAFEQLQKGNKKLSLHIDLSNDNKPQTSSIEQPKTEQKENNKIPAKFYALYHCLLIEIGTEKPFERNLDDKYSKKEIEAFAKNRYKNISSQGFYRAFIDIDLTNKIRIAKIFGKGYKEKLIIISNKSAELMKHLNKYPN